MKLYLIGASFLMAVTPLFAHAATTVHVTLTDNAVVIDQASVPAGEIKFVVDNAGVIPHEFVVLKTAAPHDQLPINASGTKVKEKGINQGEIENIEAGKSASKDYTLTAGNYVLVCNLTAHYKMGMHIGLIVN